MRAPLNKPLRGGTTIVEVLLSTLLVGVVLVAALETVGHSVRIGGAIDSQAAAFSLAEQLMTEILSHPYDDPDGASTGMGFEAGEDMSPTNRLSLDDVDDFNAWNRTPPQAADGAPLAGYTGWSRQAQVQWVNSAANGAGLVFNTGSEQGLKRVTVQVYGPGGESAVLHGYRSRLGAPGPASPHASTRVERVTAAVASGGADSLEVSTSLVNDAEGG